MHTIQELLLQGKSVRAISRELGLARNTVRKYRAGKPPTAPRPTRASKLDPYKEQIRQWVQRDRLTNCETICHRLQQQGYAGSVAIIKRFVHPLRPAPVGKRPILRYETGPGEQMQFDWAEFLYEHAGQLHRVFGFTSVLSYSRMRFVVFVTKTDAPTLIRCLMEALAYYGGLPRALLTDRMKTVLVAEPTAGQYRWHPLFADFVASFGMAPRVCKPYTPQTKGKVERSVQVIRSSFWPGVCFTDLADLNHQARAWCDALNGRVHGTTHAIPLQQWRKEDLRPLPAGYAFERFATQERKVSWDGYLAYEGVRYGVPATAGAAGHIVQVCDWQGVLRIYAQGGLILQVRKCQQRTQVIPHPDQFTTVLAAAAARQRQAPLGHQLAAPQVAHRSLAEYDALWQREDGYE